MMSRAFAHRRSDNGVSGLVAPRSSAHHEQVPVRIPELDEGHAPDVDDVRGEFGPEIAHMRHDCAEVIGPPEEAWRTVRRERRVRVQSKAGARFHRDVDDRVVMRRQGHLRTEQPAVPVGRAVDVPHRDEDLADLTAYRSRHRSIVWQRVSRIGSQGRHPAVHRHERTREVMDKGSNAVTKRRGSA